MRRSSRTTRRPAHVYAHFFVGLDVHKETITIAVFRNRDPEPMRVDRVPNDHKRLRRYFQRLSPQYESLLAVSKEIDWRFHVALVLAHETGHRAGAIAGLRWSDLDFENRQILWRAENEKTGHEHETPMTPKAFRALQYARQHAPGVGDAPVLPAPKNPSVSISRHLMRDWWKRAEKEAGLAPRRGRGCHSLIRKFASDLMDLAEKDLLQLGGWRDYNTILKCYQFADQKRLKAALATRPGSDDPPPEGGERAHHGPVEQDPPETPKLRLIK